MAMGMRVLAHAARRSRAPPHFAGTTAAVSSWLDGVQRVASTDVHLASNAEIWRSLGGASQDVMKATFATFLNAGTNIFCKEMMSGGGISVLSGQPLRRYVVYVEHMSHQNCRKQQIFPSNRIHISNYSSQSHRQSPKEERKDISTVEDPFDAPTYNIPEKPVTFAEGASYSIVILIGLGLAALAAYAVFKELIFEPKEYKIFGKALERVQRDSQVTVRIGSPVTGYGQDSRNRAARQRIPHETWKDEDGIEHVKVSFHIRGPHGFGQVYAEMFKDPSDKAWKFTYLIVEIKSPSPAQLMLESYVPA